MVRGFITIIVMLLVIGVCLIVTKPTDEQCIDLIKSKVQTSIAHSYNKNALNGFINFLSGRTIDLVKGFIRFDDKTFYKDVYFSNVKIGTAICGSFYVDDNFPNNIDEIKSNWEPKENKVSTTIEKIIDGDNNNEEPNADNSFDSNDLNSLYEELNKAYKKLNKIKKFHLLRTDEEREQQISEQEEYIQSLESRIQELQNQR